METSLRLLTSCPGIPHPAAVMLWSALSTRARALAAPSINPALAEVLAAHETDPNVLFGLLREGMDPERILSSASHTPSTEFLVKYLCRPESSLELVREHLKTRSGRAVLWGLLANRNTVFHLARNVELSEVFAAHAPVRLLVLQEPLTPATPSSRSLADHPSVLSALLERLKTANHEAAWDLALLVARRTPDPGAIQAVATSLPDAPWRNALLSWAAYVPWEPTQGPHADRAEKLAYAVHRNWMLHNTDLSSLSVLDLDNLMLFADCTPQEVLASSQLSTEQQQHLLLAFPPSEAHTWLLANPHCHHDLAASAFRAMIGTGTHEDDMDAPVSHEAAASVLVTLPNSNKIAVLRALNPWLARTLCSMQPSVTADEEVISALQVNLSLSLSSPALNSVILRSLGHDAHAWRVLAAVAEANPSLSLSDALTAVTSAAT